MSLLFTLCLVGCDKDQEKVVLNSNANVTTTVTPNNIVLEKNNDTQTALTVAWETHNVNVQISSEYKAIFSYKDKETQVSVTTSPKTFSAAELNKIAIDLGMKVGETSEMKVEIEQKVGALSLPTQKQVVKVTPYADLIDPTQWGVVGGFTQWGGQPDVPFWKVIGESSKYVAYITIKEAGEIKFRKDNKWEENFGDDGNDKTLEKGGANIKVAVGRYKILWDIDANTYTIEAYTWSIIGDGAKGWNAGDDIPLEYDGTTNTWKATNVTLKDGGIKFRFNNDWGINWGDKNMDGVLDQENDNNIKVTAGTYTITVDFSATPHTYTIK